MTDKGTNAASLGTTVLIHGVPWKFADIADEVAACCSHTWERERWQRQPALVHRMGGKTSFYHGQVFDPTKIDLVPEGWSHDHCAICWWKLHDSGSDEDCIGFTDERGDWICTECYQQFIAPNCNATGST
jgi:hypothetical protein